MKTENPSKKQHEELSEEQKAVKAKAKRKQRIQFITSKIKEMQRQRVFMTAPDMLVLDDDEEEE